MDNRIDTTVTTWQMTPEQLEAYCKKYPPKMPLKMGHRRNSRRITKARYEYLRQSGYSKKQILNKYRGLTMEHLNACLENWGIQDN